MCAMPHCVCATSEHPHSLPRKGLPLLFRSRSPHSGYVSSEANPTHCVPVLKFLHLQNGIVETFHVEGSWLTSH